MTVKIYDNNTSFVAAWLNCFNQIYHEELDGIQTYTERNILFNKILKDRYACVSSDTFIEFDTIEDAIYFKLKFI
jgi:hypothetical protein